MRDLFKLLNIVEHAEEISNSYDVRKLVDKVRVGGLEVSTCWTDDMGYETALSDINGTHPVERYQTKEEALLGHEKWTEKAKTTEKVIKLGYGDLIEDKEITLEREKEGR